MQQFSLFDLIERPVPPVSLPRPAKAKATTPPRPRVRAKAPKPAPTTPEEAERIKIRNQRAAEYEALCEPLIESGLLCRYSTSMGYSSRDPRHGQRGGVWDLPSRLMRWPGQIKAADNDRPLRLVVFHPDLADHPYIGELAAATGLALDIAEGSDLWGHHGLWHHAVDLVACGQWRDLLATRNFTTDDHIVGAVAYGLRYGPHEAKKPRGHLTIAESREILAAIGVVEPADRFATLRALSAPSPVSCDGKAQHWPINIPGRTEICEAWVMIHGIEEGWFERSRDGHLQWSGRGRACYVGEVNELL